MSSRPTYEQLETLHEFLLKYPGMAKGHLRTAYAKQDTRRRWEEITTKLNAIGGAQKDGKGWAKYWADKKCSLKKSCALYAQSLRRTGGGIDKNLPVLSPLDRKYIALMGGPEFAIGDRHVAVDPFPSSSQIHVIDHLQETPVEVDPPVPISPVHDDVHDDVTTVRDRSPVRSSAPPTNRNRTRHSRSRTNLDLERERFAEIEMRMVEAETRTASALSEAVQKMSSYTAALDNVAAAVTGGAQMIAGAINNMADAMSNIADVLRHRPCQ